MVEGVTTSERDPAWDRAYNRWKRVVDDKARTRAQRRDLFTKILKEERKKEE